MSTRRDVALGLIAAGAGSASAGGMAQAQAEVSEAEALEALDPWADERGGPGPCPGAAATGRRSRSPSAPAERVELVVGAQAGEVGQTVRHAEEGGNRRDIPDVLVAEAVPAQHRAVGLVHRLGLPRDLHGEIEHG